MTTLLVLVGWLAIGLAVVAAFRWFDVFDYDDGDAADLTIATVAWPLTIVAGLGKMVFVAVEEARERRADKREKEQREMAEAQREVERLLRQR